MAGLVCASQHGLSVTSVLLTLERNEVLHSLSPASSHCATLACSHRRSGTHNRLSHTASSFITRRPHRWSRRQPGFTACYTARPCAMVSDAQHSIRVDSCHSSSTSSTSASAHQISHLHTYSKPHTWKQFTTLINITDLSLVRCFVPRSEEFISVRPSPPAHCLLEPQELNLDVHRFAQPCSAHYRARLYPGL